MTERQWKRQWLITYAACATLISIGLGVTIGITSSWLFGVLVTVLSGAVATATATYGWRIYRDVRRGLN